MNKVKELSLAVLLVLVASISAFSVNQDSAKKDKKTAEACCSMTSCCDNEHSTQTKEGKNNHASTQGCCCCGESCDVKTGKQNHASEDGCCCSGDSCDMKNSGTSSASEGCCGDSCGMKQKEKQETKPT